MHQVNLNDYVKFKLTDSGNKIIEKYRLKLSEMINQEVSRDVVVKTDENGFEYMTLWEFMKVFGDHFHNGANPVVEDNNLLFDKFHPVVPENTMKDMALFFSKTSIPRIIEERKKAEKNKENKD